MALGLIWGLYLGRVMNGAGTATGPTNTATPVLTDTGTAMSSTTGAWAGGTITYAYQHYRDGTAISGATSASYTHGGVAGDYACLVTATDETGSRSAWSNTVTIAADEFELTWGASGAQWTGPIPNAATVTWDASGARWT